MNRNEIDKDQARTEPGGDLEQELDLTRKKKLIDVILIEFLINQEKV